MSMSDEEVAIRWRRLHRTPVLVQRFVDSQQPPLCQLEQLTLQDTLSVYRARLCDISWFMRELNEHIARQANREDECTGHFWEGRFKSQALLDEQALAACMVYVDLNPIRAAMAYSPETSHHTSIKRRLKCARQDYQPAALLPFAGNLRADSPKGLPFTLVDYLQLVDDSHRIINSSARDDADILSNPILVDLGFNQSHWTELIQDFEHVFCVAAGTLTSL
ncbi:transposase, partial [Aliiglaciecola litoralis]|uniref:transposase n=1 Tax=Aliiglaciecola litoralis TaxID=582857 RepID=UPI0031D53CB9